MGNVKLYEKLTGYTYQQLAIEFGGMTSNQIRANVIDLLESYKITIKPSYTIDDDGKILIDGESMRREFEEAMKKLTD